MPSPVTLRAIHSNAVSRRGSSNPSSIKAQAEIPLQTVYGPGRRARDR